VKFDRVLKLIIAGTPAGVSSVAIETRTIGEDVSREAEGLIWDVCRKLADSKVIVTMIRKFAVLIMKSFK
jgi:hypothetical protein